MSNRKSIREEETKLMLEKFNKLNEAYNTNTLLDSTYLCKLETNTFDVLDLQEGDIISIIEKIKSEMKTCKLNIDNIKFAMQKYEKILEDINNFKKSATELSKIYNNLSIMSGESEFENKLHVIKDFGLDYTSEVLLNAYKSEIEFKIDRLTCQFSENSNKISRFKKLILKATQEERIKNMCSICATNKINTCINPCGHVFCNTCTDKMRNCGMCRGSINTKIKLYLDDNDEEEENTTSVVEPLSAYTGSLNIVNTFPVENTLPPNDMTVTAFTPANW